MFLSNCEGEGIRLQNMRQQIRNPMTLSPIKSILWEIILNRMDFSVLHAMDELLL